MNRKNFFVVLCLLAAVFMSISDASGAKRAKQEIPLTSAAEQIYKQYSDMLTALQTEIEKAEGVEIPHGSLDITFYRDDLMAIGPRPVVGES